MHQNQLEKGCDHEQAELHNDKGTIKFKNNMNMWSILSGYLSMYTSSIVDVLIYINRFVRTIAVYNFNEVLTTNI